MRRMSIILLGTALVASSACSGGSDGPTNPNPSGNGSMSATIDGSAFVAIGIAASTSNSLLIIAGADASSRSVTISASMLQGTGVQAIGQGNAAIGQLIIGGNAWIAGGLQGGSGTINIATLTATRAAGTFSFTAPAQLGTTTPATRLVTNGQFDVVLQ
jgi:hypothetical protein